MLVADDSDIVVARLQRLLEEDDQIRVVGCAQNGTELLRLAEQCTVDVVLLDALMPEMTGLSALRHLISRARVIVVSSERSGSAVAREVIAQGAHAFFSKRELNDDGGAARLRATVLQAGRRSDPPKGGPILLVAGSTGAIGPLVELLRSLRDVVLPILVVQHLPEGKEDALSHTLRVSGVGARPAEHGESISSGVLVAPIGRHLELDRGDRIRLVDSPPVNGHRPAAEALLRSALPMARRVTAIMLSGLGSDGASAMGELAEAGATCLAQAPEDCRAPSMPLAALKASRLVRSVPVADLGRKVRRHIGHG